MPTRFHSEKDGHYIMLHFPSICKIFLMEFFLIIRYDDSIKYNLGGHQMYYIDQYRHLFSLFGWSYANVIITSLIVEAFLVITSWFIFEKAGEEGWAAIIPFYNTYILFKITWGNGWLFLLLLIPIARVVIWIMTLVKLARSFGMGGGFACGLIFLPVIFLPLLAFGDYCYAGVDGASPNSGQGPSDPYQ